MVADGRKVLFFRNDGDAQNLNLVVERKRVQDNPDNIDQRTDAPGRSFSSVGAGRSAYEETDFHQLEEDRFAAETADLLKKRAPSLGYVFTGALEGLFAALVSPADDLAAWEKRLGEALNEAGFALAPRQVALVADGAWAAAWKRWCTGTRTS